MKRFTALIMTLLLVFSFTACGKDNADKVETTTAPSTEEITDINGETVDETDFTSVSAQEGSTVPVTTADTVLLTTDPSEWTKEQVVEFYRNAAINSKNKKSLEKKELVELVVNDGDGFIGTLVELVTPILVSALEDSETEFDGITGGYENLVPDDAQSAKAYRSGEYVVVEMTMKDQIDGAHADRYGGTVGHAISVVGDLSAVEEALPQLEIGFDNAKFRLHYNKAKLKVKINKNGVIEKGTWSYSIDIDVENLYVGGRRLPLSATVKSAYGTVDYVITVGGGF